MTTFLSNSVRALAAAVLLLTALRGAERDLEVNPNQPLMSDAMHGWKVDAAGNRYAVLTTNDGGKHWVDVSPPCLKEKEMQPSDSPSLSPLDGNRAYLAVAGSDGKVVLASTRDGGNDWQKQLAPMTAAGVRISFPTLDEGFLLATSSPAVGLEDKHVYATRNEGRSWHELTAPPRGSYYPTGLVFRSRINGWITATYHGQPNAPLFYTRDGGKSWLPQTLEIPADYQGGYADTYPPVFNREDKSHGYLPVKLVRHEPPPDHEAWVRYRTDDEGVSWYLPLSELSRAGDLPPKASVAVLPESASLVNLATRKGAVQGVPVGNVKVRFTDGHSELWTRLGGCMMPDVSRNGLVGWVRTNTGVRVCWPDGHHKDFETAEPFVQKWVFADNDQAVIIGSMASHGAETFQKYDLETGKLLNQADGYRRPLPDWAQPYDDY